MRPRREQPLWLRVLFGPIAATAAVVLLCVAACNQARGAEPVRTLKFGSGFAGCGGIDLALTRAGAVGAWAAEIDKQANSVRRRHFKDETTVTDVRDVRGPAYRCDIFAAGWPCQGNSVAGKRAGLADDRSGLWWEVVRILADQRPTWFLGENVPGALSVNGGRDWATVLGSLGEVGYGFAYRVLDAQYDGVPQRRRRVFLVGCLGDWRRAAEVLFEPDCLPWDSPPSRSPREEVAGTVAGGAVGSLACNTGPNGHDAGNFACNQSVDAGHLIAKCLNAKGGSGRIDGESETFVAQRAPALSASNPYGDHESREGLLVAHTLRGEGFDASEDGTGRGTPLIPGVYPCLRSGNQYNNSDPGMESQMVVPVTFGVRRLTPLECERLQGFDDGWTEFGEHGERMADGPRYRMLGNSVAVPCVEWIARRIVRAAT